MSEFNYFSQLLQNIRVLKIFTFSEKKLFQFYFQGLALLINQKWLLVLVAISSFLVVGGPAFASLTRMCLGWLY